MKIQVSNPNGIVESAHYERNDYAASVFINTRDRWVEIDSVGICVNPQIPEEEDFVDWTFYDEKADDNDHVRLVAETKDDLSVLDRIRFELRDKDQIWILLPKKKVWNTKEAD